MLTKTPTGNGKVEVTFTMPALEQVSKLYLVGDFNDWSIALHPLTQGTDGSWLITLPLEGGRAYQFRYFDNNGHWHNDWQADAYVTNQFGGENSLVEVEDVPAAQVAAPKTAAPKAAAPKKAAPRAKAAPKAATASDGAEPKKRVVRKKKTE